jgi:hypothetical protein
MYLREYPGYTVDSLLRDFALYPEIMGEQFMEIQARIEMENEEMGKGKLDVEDAGTKRGKRLAKAKSQRSKSRMAEAEAFLRKKGRM